MKFLPLIWATLWHRTARTILTLLCIVVAFLLFGLLQAVNTALRQSVDRANVDRLVVMSTVSFTDFLPYTYLSQLEGLDGVTAVSHQTWFGATYRDPRNTIASFAVEPERFARLNTELKVPADQLEAFRTTRTGAIVGAGLVRRYGWKVGDRVAFRSSWARPDRSTDWSFDIVGIYTPQEASAGNQLFINYRYLDEARSVGRGTVNAFMVKLTDPARSAQLAETIDALFANSSSPTETRTEKEFQQSFLRQTGDINFIVTRILLAVFLALLFATASSLMQSMRERIPQFAVMKTIGFTDDAVLALVLAEALALCSLAALVGLGIANVLLHGMSGALGIAGMPPAVAVEGVVIAALLVALAGLPPALRARRLTIVEALVRR